MGGGVRRVFGKQCRHQAGNAGVPPISVNLFWAAKYRTFLPADSDKEVAEWTRTGFKRFKSLAGLGHLPKRSDDSAQAWLYGKLLLALPAEKLARHAEARAVSPCGADRGAVAQSLARVQIRAEASPPSH